MILLSAGLLCIIWLGKIAVHLCIIHSLFPSIKSIDTSKSEAILCFAPYNDKLTEYKKCIGDTNLAEPADAEFLPEKQLTTSQKCELNYLKELQDSPELQRGRNCLLDLESPYKRLVILLLDGARFDALARFKDGHNKTSYQSTLHSMHTIEDDPLVFTASGMLIASNPTTTTSMLPSMMKGIYRSSSELLSFTSGSLDVGNNNILQSLSKYGNSDIRLLGDESWVECFGEDIFTPDSYYDHYFDIFQWDEADKVLLREGPSRLSRKELNENSKRKVEIFHSLSIDSMSHVTKDLRDNRMAKAFDLSNDIVKMVAACSGIRGTELCPIPVEENDDTLLLIAADHGMTDTGGHGQDSPDEVQGLFMFASRKEFTKNIPIIKSVARGGQENEQYLYVDGLAHEYHNLHHVDLAPTLSKLTDVPSPLQAAGRPKLSLSDARVMEDLKDSTWRHLYTLLLAEEELPVSMTDALRFVYRNGGNDLDELVEAENEYRKKLLNQSTEVYAVGIVGGFFAIFVIACLLNRKIVYGKVAITYVCVKGFAELLAWFDMAIVWQYRVVSYICMAGMTTSLFVGDLSDSDVFSDSSPLIALIVIACLSRAASLVDPQHNEAFDHPSFPPPSVPPNALLYVGMFICLWRCRLSSYEMGGKRDIILPILMLIGFYVRRDFCDSNLITYNCYFAAAILCLTIILKDCAIRYVIYLWFILGTDSANKPLVLPLILFVVARSYFRHQLLNQAKAEVKCHEIFGVIAVINVLWYHTGNRENFEFPFYSLNTFALFQSNWGKVIAYMSVIIRISIPLIFGYSLFFDLISNTNLDSMVKEGSKTSGEAEHTGCCSMSAKIAFNWIFSGIRCLCAFDGLFAVCNLLIVIGRIGDFQFNSMWGPRFILLSAFSATLPITCGLGGIISTYGSRLLWMDGNSTACCDRRII